MIQLSGILWLMAVVFAVIGYGRGLTKELIALAGIILALFAIDQFDFLIRQQLLANSGATSAFYVQSMLFLGIVYFAYQTRALGGRELVKDRKEGEGRDKLQSTVLGAVIGFLNGYLIIGTLWNLMAVNDYPLRPYIIAPSAGEQTDAVIRALPLNLLGGGIDGGGSVLSVAVIVLFIIVLIVI
jgi:Colicin V production protein